MIGIVLSSLLALQSTQASSDGTFIKDSKAYKTCVRASALIFERAKESLSDTVAASFAKCQNERATILLGIVDRKEKQGQDYSIERAESFVDQLIDKSLRDEITVLIIEIRAGIR